VTGEGKPVTKSVAVLGTGLMGTGMARSLLRAGLDVTVWNRSAGKARPLADAGATAVADVGPAVSDVDVVVTMLFDADAVAEVMGGALPAMRPNSVWVQSGTVGIEGAERLAALAAKHGIGFVDAPVLGTRKPAEEGELIVLAGGPVDLREAVTPVFDAVGRRTVWVGERPGEGQRLKLAASAWVLSVTASTAQSVALATALGLDGRMFLDVISGGPLDCAYAQFKGKAMLEGDFTPSFSTEGAAKDTRLIADAMRASSTDDRLMTALHSIFHTATKAGYGDEDMAAVVRAFHP
jgi:3-hydroxyisobutyrate dehydrogenase